MIEFLRLTDKESVRDESSLLSESDNPVEGASLVSVLGAAEDESLIRGEIMIDT